MPRPQRAPVRSVQADQPGRSSRRFQAAGALVAATAALLLAGSGLAGAASIGQLKQRIGSGKGTISNLSGALSATSSHLSQLNARVATLTGQVSSIEAKLRARESELFTTELQLTAARNRLHKLERLEAHAEAVLSRRMLNSYEAERPDLVTVVLESSGFRDLLERIAFAQRIQKQDVQVATQVRSTRRAVAKQAVHLGALEVRQRALADQVARERNTLVRAQESVLRQRIAVAQNQEPPGGAVGQCPQRSGQPPASALPGAGRCRSRPGSPGPAGPAGQRPDLLQQRWRSTRLSAELNTRFRAEQRRLRVPAAQERRLSAEHVVASTRALTSPHPATPPSTRSAPERSSCTASAASDPGRRSCTATARSDGYDYVYYGHAGPQYQLAVGTHVSAGQVMSSIGPGSLASPPARTWRSGSATPAARPIGRQTAGTMMSLLQSAPTIRLHEAHQADSAPSHAPAPLAHPRALLAQLVEHFHGKEGVVGSSPTEGSLSDCRVDVSLIHSTRITPLWLPTASRPVLSPSRQVDRAPSGSNWCARFEPLDERPWRTNSGSSGGIGLAK